MCISDWLSQMTHITIDLQPTNHVYVLLLIMFAVPLCYCLFIIMLCQLYSCTLLLLFFNLEWGSAGYFLNLERGRCSTVQRFELLLWANLLRKRHKECQQFGSSGPAWDLLVPGWPEVVPGRGLGYPGPAVHQLIWTLPPNTTCIGTLTLGFPVTMTCVQASMKV